MTHWCLRLLYVSYQNQTPSNEMTTTFPIAIMTPDDTDQAPAQPIKILLIDADSLTRRSWETTIRSEGYTVAGTGDADAALMLTESFDPDVIVLDISLPVRAHGFDLFAEIRRRSTACVVATTSLSDEIQRVRLLRAGADDVLQTPISSMELAARIDALSRRARRTEQPTQVVVMPSARPTEAQFGPLRVEFERRSASIDGVSVLLTRIEWELLAEMCRRPRGILERGELLKLIWGGEWKGDDHVVDVHVSNLRRKLAAVRPDVLFIQTVRGIGFRLSDDIV
jgi:DNA-binding response OmpR family regulator